MKEVKFLTILVAMLLSCILMNAQQLSWRRYTVNDGLLQSQISTVFQDSKGYMWIASRLGVSRFDGIHFVNYTEKDGLFGRWAIQISEDRDGNIWFLYHQGMTRFDGQTFKSFAIDDEVNSHRAILLVPYSTDSASVFKLSEKNELIELNFSKGQFVPGHKFQLSDEFQSAPVFTPEPMFNNESKSLWLSDLSGGLFVFQSGAVQKIEGFDKPIQGYQIGPNGKCYCMSDGSLYIVEDQQAVQLINSLYKNTDQYTQFAIEIDQIGNIIICEDNQPSARLISAENLHITPISMPLTTDIYLDQEENLWCGTENGLYLANSLAFINFIPEKDELNQNVWSVVEGKNETMYFASYYDGLQKLSNGNFVHVDGIPSFSSTQATNLAMGSIVDAEQNVYFTSSYYPLIKFDGKNFKPLPENIEQTPSFIIRQSQYDSSLLIGAHKKYFRIYHDKMVDSLTVGPGNWKSSTITGIEEDKYNRVWLGGFNGMSLLIGDSLIHLPTPDFPFEAGGNTLLRDYCDNLWIGNLDGLYFYDYEGFTKIEDPLLDELVVTLVTVGDSTLYIGTIKRIVLFDMRQFYKDRTLQLTAVGPDKGFDAIEPGQNGFFKDSKGYLWLPTNDRVVRIDPALVRKNLVAPNVYIADMYKLGDKMNWLKVEKADANQQAMSFSHRDKNLRFEFIGISQGFPQGVNYSFMLDGYDLGWSAPSPERTAVYTNLPPGDYRFMVKAANSDGVWSVSVAVKEFTIVPAVYQRMWFKIMGIVLAMLLIFGSGLLVMYLLRRRQKWESENARKMSELRLLSIHNQIDPHFTYNAINSIAASLLGEDRQTAYIYFVKLSKLMRAILKQNNQLTTTLEEEIDFVNSYVQIQQYRFKNHFDFELKIDEVVNLQTTIPKMCIQTFAENAIKHGLLPRNEKGKLIIHVYNEYDKLCLLIQDNGIGREKAAREKTSGTSNGLRIISGYFDYFNQFNSKKLSYKITDLFDAEQQAAGTSILILIPIDFSYQKL